MPLVAKHGERETVGHKRRRGLTWPVEGETLAGKGDDKAGGADGDDPNPEGCQGRRPPGIPHGKTGLSGRDDNSLDVPRTGESKGIASSGDIHIGRGGLVHGFDEEKKKLAGDGGDRGEGAVERGREGVVDGGSVLEKARRLVWGDRNRKKEKED